MNSEEKNADPATFDRFSCRQTVILSKSPLGLTVTMQFEMAMQYVTSQQNAWVVSHNEEGPQQHDYIDIYSSKLLVLSPHPH